MTLRDILLCRSRQSSRDDQKAAPSDTESPSQAPHDNYFFGGVKVSLALLVTLASAVPIPWVKTALETTLRLVEIADVSDRA